MSRMMPQLPSLRSGLAATRHTFGDGLREATVAVSDGNADTINLSGWTSTRSPAGLHLNNHRNLSKVSRFGATS
jgi:hypothetical protein